MTVGEGAKGEETVGLATGIIMAIGGVVFGLKKSKWKN